MTASGNWSGSLVWRKQSDGQWAYVQRFGPGGNGTNPAYWHAMNGDGNVIAAGRYRGTGFPGSGVVVYKYDESTQTYQTIGSQMTFGTSQRHRSPKNFQMSAAGDIIAIPVMEYYGQGWSFRTLSHDWDDPAADWVQYAPDIYFPTSLDNVGDREVHSAEHGAMSRDGTMMVVVISERVASGLSLIHI